MNKHRHLWRPLAGVMGTYECKVCLDLGRRILATGDVEPYDDGGKSIRRRQETEARTSRWHMEALNREARIRFLRSECLIPPDEQEESY
jgi:hypothetical protein